MWRTRLYVRVGGRARRATLDLGSGARPLAFFPKAGVFLCLGAQPNVLLVCLRVNVTLRLRSDPPSLLRFLFAGGGVFRPGVARAGNHAFLGWVLLFF